MKVYIRKEDTCTGTGHYAFDINSPKELDGLIVDIRKWGGVYLPDEGVSTDDLSGQIVLDDNEAYAEIIVGAIDNAE